MELLKAIKDRRSIRRYKEKSLGEKIIKDLLNCARLAPSAKNRQPWRFVVVRKSTKNKIADIMLKKEKSLNVNSKNEEDKAKRSVIATAEIVKEAPVFILVFRKKDDDWTTGDTLSIGAAIEHICLRATDLGLGSLWVRDSVYSQKEISKLVGCANMEFVASIVIGEKNEFPLQRPRIPLTEIVKWI